MGARLDPTSENVPHTKYPNKNRSYLEYARGLKEQAGFQQGATKKNKNDLNLLARSPDPQVQHRPKRPPKTLNLNGWTQDEETT